jgi:hypothetical protein
MEENKLLTFARSIPDIRMDMKKLHLAENVVFIALVAVICGAGTWEGITVFGRSKKNFLVRFIKLENGIPSQDTFNRFLTV